MKIVDFSAFFQDLKQHLLELVKIIKMIENIIFFFQECKPPQQITFDKFSQCLGQKQQDLLFFIEITLPKNPQFLHGLPYQNF